MLSDARQRDSSPQGWEEMLCSPSCLCTCPCVGYVSWSKQGAEDWFPSCAEEEEEEYVEVGEEGGEQTAEEETAAAAAAPT